MTFLFHVLRGSCTMGRLVLSEGEIAVLRAIDAEISFEANHAAWRDLMACISLKPAEAEYRTQGWLRDQDVEIVTHVMAA